LDRLKEGSRLGTWDLRLAIVGLRDSRLEGKKGFRRRRRRGGIGPHLCSNFQHITYNVTQKIGSPYPVDGTVRNSINMYLPIIERYTYIHTVGKVAPPRTTTHFRGRIAIGNSGMIE
jgi:hypothetical protein